MEFSVMLKSWAIVALNLVLVGCNQYPDNCPVRGDGVVEIRASLDDSSNAPLPLQKGESLVGAIVTPGTMRVDAVAVQIANGGGKADGGLKIRVCQADLCSNGESQLMGSQDNDFLSINLNPSMLINYGRGPLKYTITRESGVEQMSVWTYPAYGNIAHIQVGDQIQQRTINMLLIQN
jgi:hypothetical protein